MVNLLTLVKLMYVVDEKNAKRPIKTSRQYPPIPLTPKGNPRRRTWMKRTRTLQDTPISVHQYHAQWTGPNNWRQQCQGFSCAYKDYNEPFNERRKMLDNKFGDYNKKKRYQMYRYIHLNDPRIKYVCNKFPTCVVDEIRKQYPDQAGNNGYLLFCPYTE